MPHFSIKNMFILGALCAGPALLTTGCSDWDLDNIDMTMGLGSDGLGVKLGKTEQILLKDILEVDGSVKLDKNNLYYLVEDGSTKFDVKVEPVYAHFEKTDIRTDQRVLSFESALEQSGAPAGITELTVTTDFQPSGLATGQANVDFTVNDVKDDIISVSSAGVEKTPVVLKMFVKSSPSVKFDIKELKDFSINLPAFLHVCSVSEGWEVTEGNVLKTKKSVYPYTSEVLCELTVDEARFGEDGKNVNGTISLNNEKTATKVNGEVAFTTSQEFTMHQGDYADVAFSLQLGTGDRIKVERATGVFDPVIDPTVDPIDIKSSLPDFMQDPAVRIKASNPTIKFRAGLTQIPVGVNFSADLTSEKAADADFPRNVELPKVLLEANQESFVYYFQGEAPYDTIPVPETAKQLRVDNINTLFEKVPDQITVDMQDGKLRADQSREYTVELGKKYQANADYDVLVPFEFNEGLVIVYNDSTDSMKDDLKDYAAEGIQVKAVAHNAIPLELLATITAVNTDGAEIPGVKFSQATIAPSEDGKTEKATEIVMNADLDDPNLLKQIDRLFFKINASSKAAVNNKAHQLFSTQYLQLNDIKLYLKGQITADFN